MYKRRRERVCVCTGKMEESVYRRKSQQEAGVVSKEEKWCDERIKKRKKKKI